MNSTRSLRPALLAVVGLAFALALLGCGSDDGDDDALTTGDGATSTTEADTTTTTTDASTTTDGDDADPGGGDDVGGSDDGGGEAGSGGTDGSDDGSGSGSGGDGGSPDLTPGDECDLDAGIADCIDPDGDGVGVYLVDGDLCASTAPDVSACEDADGDGVAGGEDEYSDLPPCGPDVAPPCNNQPGDHER